MPTVCHFTQIDEKAKIDTTHTHTTRRTYLCTHGNWILWYQHQFWLTLPGHGNSGDGDSRYSKAKTFLCVCVCVYKFASVAVWIAASHSQMNRSTLVHCLCHCVFVIITIFNFQRNFIEKQTVRRQSTTHARVICTRIVCKWINRVLREGIGECAYSIYEVN